MNDPVATCADLVIGKAIDGVPVDRLLGMIPAADRPAVARRVSLELACATLEAADLQLAPDRARAPGEAGGTTRRLARFLIALHRVDGAPAS